MKKQVKVVKKMSKGGSTNGDMNFQPKTLVVKKTKKAY